MELRVLTYFLMVAREENITKASQLLHVTQPTLSRQLMQLEDELGTKLFVRGSHKINLTEEGMQLKRRAQDIVSLTEKTIREFHSEKEDYSGEITIGGGELLCIDYFSKILEAFQKRHPAVRYNIRSGTADDTKDKIESGLIDIGVMIEPGDISKYESVRIPQKETYGVVVKSDSSIAKQGFATPKDLAEIPLLMSTRMWLENNLASWFGDYYDKLDVKVTYNLTYNSVALVKNNIGSALTVKLNWQMEGVTFVPLEPALSGNSYFVWKKNETLAPATGAFIEFARDWIKSKK